MTTLLIVISTRGDIIEKKKTDNLDIVSEWEKLRDENDNTEIMHYIYDIEEFELYE